MVLSEQLERFSKAPTQYKVAGMVGMLLIIGALFYLLFYSDLSSRTDEVKSQISLLQQEVTSYEDKKQKYMAFRAEVTKLLEEQKDLIKALPTEKKIYAFIQSLHAQGELAGLNILNLEQAQEYKQNFYAKIPVKMVVRGSFQQIKKFFYAVGRLKRIVNVQNLMLGLDEVSEKGIWLKATFLANTFRFLVPQQPTSPKQAGG